MGKSIITEIASFEISTMITQDDFIKRVDFLEKEFHSKQAGHIDSELIKAEDNSWLMIMHWSSIEEAKNASKLLMKSDKAEEFKNSLLPQTVKIKYYNQVQSWN